MSAHQPPRYQLESKIPGKKGSQHTCPGCNARKQFTRYADTRTGDLLPDEFGICNNGSKCAYHLSPYHKGSSMLSYADGVRQRDALPRHWFTAVGNWQRSGISRQSAVDSLVLKEAATHEQAGAVTAYIYDKAGPRQTITRTSATPLTKSVYTIPDAVFKASLTGYERNNFTGLLFDHFGAEVARKLIERFHIGTSGRWPGANVFWVIDAVGRVRGGQVVCYDNSPGSDHENHKAKYTNHEGNRQPCITSAAYAIAHHHKRRGTPAPNWLADYEANGETFPVCYGAHQLQNAPPDAPAHIVEGPATAVFCSGTYGGLWLAVGSLDWLTAERLSSVKHRPVTLYPDLAGVADEHQYGSAYLKWCARAEVLNAGGFNITVSSLLEDHCRAIERVHKYDLRDYLLDFRRESGYPPVFDSTSPPGMLPQLSQRSVKEWLAKGQTFSPTNEKITEQHPVAEISKPIMDASVNTLSMYSDWKTRQFATRSNTDLLNDRSRLWGNWPRPPLSWERFYPPRFIERI